MVARTLEFLVVNPVGIEVVADLERAKLQDGFSPSEAPARTGDGHSIADEMAASALNDTRRDGVTGRQTRVVPKVLAVIFNVIGGRVGRLALPG
jgi:hypothetical protein